MKYLIDTSAWIEYLEGSEKGENVNALFNNEDNEITTIPLIIAEVISKVTRKKGNIGSAFALLSSCVLLAIDGITAKEAGLLHTHEKEKNQNFSLADALILKVAQRNNLKLITTDRHFKSFKEATIL
ncbi:MAG: PIN domain-containing protein [Nanoarchaeota archaeon]|mgnify:FL=1